MHEISHTFKSKTKRDNHITLKHFDKPRRAILTHWIRIGQPFKRHITLDSKDWSLGKPWKTYWYPKTTHTYSQFWLIWSDWYTSNSLKTFKRSYWHVLVDSNLFQEGYNCITEFDCIPLINLPHWLVQFEHTTSLKRYDWFIQLGRTNFFEQIYWTVHIDSLTYLEQSDWSAQLDHTTFF